MKKGCDEEASGIAKATKEAFVFLFSTSKQSGMSKRSQSIFPHRVIRFVSVIALIAIAIESAPAQWSTSTHADSALYVCPGFVQTILTFSDGSSIICGALNDSRYAQKLDPYGYKMWPQPVRIMNTPGTNNDGISTPISDGSGGFFVGWPDNRGSEFGQYGPFNNAAYMQHIDKNGGAFGGDSGIQLAPVTGGLKSGNAICDGQGGIIWYMRESDFLRTNASMRERTWLIAFDAAGKKKWEHPIDSSTVQYQLQANQPIKLGNKFMIRTLEGARFIDPSSGDTLPHPSYVPKGQIIAYGDSIAYAIEYKGYDQDSVGVVHHRYSVTQIDSNWNPTWNIEFGIDDEGDGSSLGGPVNTSFVVDKHGGFFFVWNYRTMDNILKIGAHWISKLGFRWGLGGKRFAQRNCYATFNGDYKVGMYFSGGTAQVYDTSGQAVWSSDVIVTSDPMNAYSPTFASDNNGGAIIAYWTTLGGIFAQHTGRVGKVGTITKVRSATNAATSFAMKQNFPNPFNPSTTIEYQIPKNGLVKIEIYDLQGRKLRTLVDRSQGAGSYRIAWDGRNSDDQIATSGVYYCRLVVDGIARGTMKTVLLK